MLNKIKSNKKLVFYIGGIVTLIIALIVGALLINMITGGSRTFEKAENKLKESAIKYYDTHNALLPANVGDQVVVTDSQLTEAKFMDKLEKFVPKDSTCTGQVIVKKNASGYSYTPYLDCGKDYYSIELFKDIINSKNVVTSGDGLYTMNGEYVFRGEKVNNYVSLGDDNLWRIVKVNSNNQIVLIKNSTGDKVYWDDRYNTEKGYNTGINNYMVSRIKDDLAKFYKTDFISKEMKTKLAPQNVCVGKRGEDVRVNDGSVECSVLFENQMISLLSIHDYINASIDSTCASVSDESCQNYNYLAPNVNGWWTITGTASNTYDVYYVDNYGEIDLSRASSLASLKPVIYLDSSVMKGLGDGSSNNPYIIK